ncbi:MAG: ketoacyl-ACP synthase III [Deltaproteobacteria bacterium HGW-Deltaproteobacteria-7]|jgi:3-oxoacyl-[acyl-carrier-protein] synthase-3|nr:MAG: ketoacyl-ACP synthase III [Deltaproteobacteria bacterium HGW-Deltaproteobacteria-7]PKN53758.1 MAG: ketoacyl-ACP synthase III [Deltaproteobacteria bacterium HGW-Deltaproteobacteria-13]
MLYLHSMGHFNPENVLSNKFLEELDIGTTNDWIMERVGIQTRRTVLPLDYIKKTKNINPLESFSIRQYKNSQMGARAARMALERASLTPADIGMLIAGTSSPDNIAPAEASAMAAELGIEAACFDLNSSCSTFGMHVNLIMRMQPELLTPYILLIGAESPTRSVNYSDRNSAILFGDGAIAAVVSTKIPARAAFVSGDFDSRPSEWRKVGIDGDWTFHQEGKAIQVFAVKTTTEYLKVLQDQYASAARRLIFIGHQANLTMLKSVCKRREIKPENHWYNVDQFGNTGCCGAPASLSMHWDEIQPGDNIAMVIVGAGLTWTYMMLKVENEP